MAGIINVVPLPPNFDPKDRFCGTTINNRFYLTGVLGKGNFGVAYCATDKETQKKVAVKKIKTEGDVDHVKNEAVLLTNLNHVHIVQFVDSFFNSGFFWIVLEFCEGGDLETKIKEVSDANCKFKPNAILRWTYQMLDALQYMHSRKVLHRDLKPANILLVNNDVKLADFGVSKQLLASTYQGQGAGTILYMSPEMLKGEKYNAKSDIWSLGCVFYELFTLTPIYQALNVINFMAYMVKILNSQKLPDLNDNRYNVLFQSMMDYNVQTRPNATTLIQDKVFAKFGGSGVGPDSLKISIEVGTLTEQRVGAVVLWVRDNLTQVTNQMTTLGISQDFNLKAATATGILESNVQNVALMYCKVYTCKLSGKPDRKTIVRLAKNSLEQAEQEAYSRIAFSVPSFCNLEDVLCSLQDAFTSFKPFHLEDAVILFEKSQQNAAEFCQRMFETKSTRINNLEVNVLRGDITLMKSEGFVNSVGWRFKLNTGTLSNAIAQQGGEILSNEMKRSASKLSSTSRLTSGGNISAVRKVFHVNLKKVKDVEKEVLHILKQSAKSGIRTLAIPAIGTGVLGFDPKLVARGIREALEQFTEAALPCATNQPCSLKKVDIVVFQAGMLEAFQMEIVEK